MACRIADTKESVRRNQNVYFADEAAHRRDSPGGEIVVRTGARAVPDSFIDDTISNEIGAHAPNILQRRFPVCR
jgi:hypothetical protein